MDKANFVTSDDKGGDVNTKHNKNGQWSIFRSIWNNSWNVFTKRHWNKGVDATDEKYPLHKACSDGDRETVELLLKNNAQINETDEQGDTPLFHAVKYGWKDIVNILLDAGADVNRAELGNTPLHLAAYNGYADLVKILIDRGAHINSRDMYGTTPLHWAVKRPNEIIALKKTKNKKHCGSSSVTSDDVEIVELLLDNGADINIADRNGELALLYAHRHKKMEITEILLHECNLTEQSSNMERGINLPLMHDLNFYDTKWFYEMLKKYVIKAKILGLLENKKDLGDYPFNMYDFQIKCQDEVEFMKCAIINNMISIYQVATLSTDQLEPYFRNELTVQSFICCDYKTKFPIYGSMIKSSFRRGLAKRELFKYGELFLTSVFQGMPHICCLGILSYLNNTDLKILANIVKDEQCMYKNNLESLIVINNM